MLYSIKSASYSARIDSLGAELTALECLDCGKNMLWCADPDVWGKTSPVLFPVIGPLTDGGYTHNGKQYKLPRHGFSRECEWTAMQECANCVTFTLKSDAKSLAVYPFEFEASLTYTLDGAKLSIDFCVTNTGNVPLFYEYGAHPAFATEKNADILQKDGELNECTLTFAKPFNCTTMRLGEKSGLVNTTRYPVTTTDTINLNSDLFNTDALILTDLPAEWVILTRPSYPKVKVDFKGLPVLGVWAATGTKRYVCIEPWSCVPEFEGAPTEISKKPNAIKLEPTAKNNHVYSIEIL